MSSKNTPCMTPAACRARRRYARQKAYRHARRNRLPQRFHSFQDEVDHYREVQARELNDPIPDHIATFLKIEFEQHLYYIQVRSEVKRMALQHGARVDERKVFHDADPERFIPALHTVLKQVRTTHPLLLVNTRRYVSPSFARTAHEEILQGYLNHYNNLRSLQKETN